VVAVVFSSFLVKVLYNRTEKCIEVTMLLILGTTTRNTNCKCGVNQISRLFRGDSKSTPPLLRDQSQAHLVIISFGKSMRAKIINKVRSLYVSVKIILLIFGWMATKSWCCTINFADLSSSSLSSSCACLLAWPTQPTPTPEDYRIYQHPYTCDLR
jgi:hypothetical protein